MLQMQSLRRVWIEPSVGVDRGQRTLEVEEPTQPLHTEPGERNPHSANEGFSDRIFKRDGLDGISPLGIPYSELS